MPTYKITGNASGAAEIKREKVRELLNMLESDTFNALTAAQRQEILRRGLRAVVMFVFKDRLNE